MSHFTRIQTVLREKEFLVTALENLKYQYRVSDTEDLIVRGYQENTERAEIVLNTGSSYDIGFQRRSEQFQMVGDWYGISDQRYQKEKLLEDISLEYNQNLITEKIEEDYMILQEVRELENGDRVIIAVTR